MIDLHTHLHPPKLFAAIRRWFADRSDWDLAAQPSEPHAVAAVLRAHGVERFAFCSYAHKPGIARDLNAWLVRTSHELDGYGVPLATVHLDDPAYVADAIDAFDGGCVGLKVHEDVQRLAIDDARFAPIFEEMSRRRAFVLVHVGPIPWRYDAGDGVARIARVLAAHPELRIVVAHFGAPDSLAYFDLMARYPHLYLDTTMIFAAGSPMHAGDELASYARAIARRPERVVLGTDFPNIPYAYDREARGIAALCLEPQVERAILRDNGARLLEAAVHGIS
ncbi:MAG: amidohydrolase family protein [Vulcanimicrobiaceae bacterium]